MGETAVTRLAHDQEIPGAIPGHPIPSHGRVVIHSAVTRAIQVRLLVWGFHWLKVEVDIHLVYTEKEVGASPSQPITHVQGVNRYMSVFQTEVVGALPAGRR